MNALLRTIQGGIVGAIFLLEFACAAQPGDEAIAAPASEPVSNPYLVIVDKNAFRLNPPPVSAEPQKPAPVLPMIHLGGFMQNGDQTKVLLSVKLANPDPHAAATDSYVVLEEGEKKTVGPDEQGVTVQLVRIYANEEKVDIINSGTAVTLSMQKDGFEEKATPSGPQTALTPPSPVSDLEAARQRAAKSSARNVSGAPPKPPRAGAGGARGGSHP